MTPWHHDTMTNDSMTPWHPDSMKPWRHDVMTPRRHDTISPIDHDSMMQAFLSKTIDTPALDLPPLGDEVRVEHCLKFWLFLTVSYCLKYLTVSNCLKVLCVYKFPIVSSDSHIYLCLLKVTFFTGGFGGGWINIGLRLQVMHKSQTSTWLQTWKKLRDFSSSAQK